MTDLVSLPLHPKLVMWVYILLFIQQSQLLKHATILMRLKCSFTKRDITISFTKKGLHSYHLRRKITLDYWLFFIYKFVKNVSLTAMLMKVDICLSPKLPQRMLSCHTTIFLKSQHCLATISIQTTLKSHEALAPCAFLKVRTVLMLPLLLLSAPPIM